jgi:hypothetical protein
MKLQRHNGHLTYFNITNDKEEANPSSKWISICPIGNLSEGQHPSLLVHLWTWKTKVYLETSRPCQLPIATSQGNRQIILYAWVSLIYGCRRFILLQHHQSRNAKQEYHPEVNTNHLKSIKSRKSSQITESSTKDSTLTSIQRCKSFTTPHISIAESWLTHSKRRGKVYTHILAKFACALLRRPFAFVNDLEYITINNFLVI